MAIPGCSVADDYGHALGDRNEARLSAALGYLANQSCPAVSGSSAGGVTQAAAATVGDGELFKGPFRENRILRR